MMLASFMLLFFFSLRATLSAEAGLKMGRTVSDHTDNNKIYMLRMISDSPEESFDGGLSEMVLEKLKYKLEGDKQAKTPLVMRQSTVYKLWVEETNIRTQTEKRDKTESGWRSPKVPGKNSYFSK